MSEYLSELVKIVPAVPYTAAAQSAITGSTVDCLGFDRVCYLITFGTVTSSGTGAFKVAQDTSSGFGTTADIAGSGLVWADTDSDKVRYIDVPVTDRYQRLLGTRATANSIIGAATALLYRGKALPVTHPSAVTGEQFANPGEGTA